MADGSRRNTVSYDQNRPAKTRVPNLFHKGPLWLQVFVPTKCYWCAQATPTCHGVLGDDLPLDLLEEARFCVVEVVFPHGERLHTHTHTHCDDEQVTQPVA